MTFAPSSLYTIKLTIRCLSRDLHKSPQARITTLQLSRQLPADMKRLSSSSDSSRIDRSNLDTKPTLALDQYTPSHTPPSPSPNSNSTPTKKQKTTGSIGTASPAKSETDKASPKKVKSGMTGGGNANGNWDGHKRAMLMEEVIAAGYKALDLEALASKVSGHDLLILHVLKMELKLKLTSARTRQAASG